MFRCFLTTLLLLLAALLPVSRGADPASLRVVFGVVGVEQPEGKGLIVTRLARLSPAEQAGVRPTDLLISVAGHPVPTRPDLVEALAACSPGDEIPVTLLRGGREKRLLVTLGERAEVLKAEPRPVAPLSGETMGLIIECQQRMARELAREVPNTALLLELGAQIRTLSGGVADAGTATLRYTDAQGVITLTAAPDVLELEADGKHYFLNTREVTQPLPESLRARLRAESSL